MQPLSTAQKVGHAIRGRRLQAGLSQDRFADSINMHRAYFSAIERGEKNITLETLERIAGGLSVSPSILLKEGGL